ncbi:MAG: cupredoxin domain-containing protein [Anaerolineales bacterium]
MWRTFSILVVVGLLLFTACGSKPSATSTEVQITLTDFAIQSTHTEFQAGVTYHFVVTNKGQVPHELMIMPPVEVHAGMSMDMEELHEIALVMVEEEDLPPGATYSFDFTFTEPAPPGKLEFACHVTGHYEAGMKLGIVVK